MDQDVRAYTARWHLWVCSSRRRTTQKETNYSRPRLDVVPFTGDAWLDGVVWGRGIRLNAGRARVRVSDFPDETLAEFERRVKAVGIAIEVGPTTTDETGYWFLAASSPSFADLTRSITDRRVETTASPAFLEGFLASRLTLGQGVLRLNWTQVDLPEVLAPHGLEVRGTDPRWRLLAPARRHPLIERHCRALDAMAEEAAPLSRTEAAARDRDRVPVDPFLSRVYWYLVERPCTGMDLWNTFRSRDCPFTHHTQFIGSILRLEPDEDHPGPVARYRIRSDKGAIESALPPLLFVEGSVTDLELELEALTRFPEIASAARQKQLDLRAHQEMGVARGRLFQMVTARLAREIADADVLAEEIFRRTDRPHRLQEHFLAREAEEVSGVIAAVLAEGFGDQAIEYDPALARSRPFCTFLDWLARRGASVEAPEWHHPDLVPKVVLRGIRHIRVVPPSNMMEVARMFAEGDLRMSETTREALALAKERLPGFDFPEVDLSGERGSRVAAHVVREIFEGPFAEEHL